MSNPLLELKKQYDELKTDDERNIWRLAHLDGPMAEVFLESEEASFDHTGLEEMVSGRAPAKARPTIETLADTMYGEFQERFGYKPSEETAKLAAVGFQGDLFDEAGRDAFYQRVAAYDGRSSRGSQDSSEHRTPPSGRGGAGSLSDRMAAATAYPGEQQDNEDFVRGIHELQFKAGVTRF